MWNSHAFSNKTQSIHQNTAPRVAKKSECTNKSIVLIHVSIAKHSAARHRAAMRQLSITIARNTTQCNAQPQKI